MNLARRIARLEEQATAGGDLEGARRMVQFGLFAGYVDPSSDTKALARKWAQEGRTIGRLLDEVVTRGLPSEEDFEDYSEAVAVYQEAKS